MKISMYEASVPAFVRGLSALKAVLEKGAAHAAAKKIDESVFVNARLYPDMLPLKAQVYIATDFARGTAARLTGTEPAKWEDNEATFADLIARVDRALEAVRAVPLDKFEGAEDRSIVRTLRGEPKTFTGLNYLQQFSLPNFYFHCATAYGILRSQGLEIGKMDFLGTLD